MNAEEFLKQLGKLAEENRGSFSAGVLDLTKLAAAEAVRVMIGDANFAVKINAIKAVRKYQLDLYEKELIQTLLDDAFEVKVAAIKTLASFGNIKHYPLIRTFYQEQPQARPLLIDSFVNYSDTYEVYEFVLGELVSDDEKIREAVVNWFTKAFGHDILLPWIVKAYHNAPFPVRRAFERSFTGQLPALFNDELHGYRFKVAYLTGKGKGRHEPDTH